MKNTKLFSEGLVSITPGDGYSVTFVPPPGLEIYGEKTYTFKKKKRILKVKEWLLNKNSTISMVVSEFKPQNLGLQSRYSEKQINEKYYEYAVEKAKSFL